jgi:DNA-binding NarL/FixJ family response regulator
MINNSVEIRVALVDDSAMIRECLFYFLSIWGYSIIIQACNGKDFLNQLNEDNLPDICILDLNMPELNGYETLKILKKSWPGIKVLVFSMDITNEANDKIADADAVLSKSDINKIKSVLQQLSQQIMVTPEQ